MRRRAIILTAFSIFGLGLVQPGAHAAVEAPFTQAAFAAAQQAGKPILLHITAPWCPTCTAQKPIIDQLAANPTFKDMVILRVDFDSQKDVVRAVNARVQSTLIVYRGIEERGRSAGDTNAASITALVHKSVN